MKIKNLVTDVKAWIYLIIVISIVTATIMGYAQLPKKVKEVEEKVETTEENLSKLSSTIEQYVAVQAVRDKAQERREELMLKLIEQLKDK